MDTGREGEGERRRETKEGGRRERGKWRREREGGGRGKREREGEKENETDTERQTEINAQEHTHTYTQRQGQRSVHGDMLMIVKLDKKHMRVLDLGNFAGEVYFPSACKSQMKVWLGLILCRSVLAPAACVWGSC